MTYIFIFVSLSNDYIYLNMDIFIGFAQAWRRAGDALGELRQYHSAIEYYEVTMKMMILK